MIILITVLMVGYFLRQRNWIYPLGNNRDVVELSLEKYDFDSLRHRGGVVSNLEILGEVEEINIRRGATHCARTKNMPCYSTREIKFISDNKGISGVLNYYPEKSSLSPVIIMIRGYAEREGYYPGSGTWRVADRLAEAGYATISLDFLGYGNSELESTDMLEARFHKVVEVLDLIESVKNLPWIDKNRVGIWAHSNGGQIALSVLEITGAKYPTILWAPMTMAFPESVLSTIDEGSPVKEAIIEFEKHYDARRYAFENYYDWIRSPILIQQGTADDQVKVDWQRKVVEELAGKGKAAELIIYNGADHNLKNSWEEAVVEDVGWFKKNW